MKTVCDSGYRGIVLISVHAQLLAETDGVIEFFGGHISIDHCQGYQAVEILVFGCFSGWYLALVLLSYSSLR